MADGTGAKYTVDGAAGEPEVEIHDGKSPDVQKLTSADQSATDAHSPARSVHKQPSKPGPTKRTITLFERCTGGWLNLRFDSDILEKFYMECTFPQARDRFRFAMGYLALVSASWLIYFAAQQVPYWPGYVGGCAAGLFFSLLMLGLSWATELLRRCQIWIYMGTSIIFCILILLTFAFPVPSASLVFNFTLVVQMILLMYTMIPLRLWQALLLASLLSVIHVVLATFHYKLNPWRFIVVHILGHIAVHGVGLIIQLMSQVRRRSTFLKLGQSAQIQKEITVEQQVKNDMIRSLMPAKVAQEVMNEEANKSKTPSGGGAKGGKGKRGHGGKGASGGDSSGSDDEDDDGGGKQIVKGSGDNDDEEGGTEPEVKEGQSDVESQSGGGAGAVVAEPKVVTFRKFHVNQMKDVSIAFADIVGFTKMSSNKTAPHLVFLLNDLFGRFDRLCELTGCEKIATLGDCYYCVSGCPNEKPDSAECCVEMGRAMCLAIRQFDEDHKEEVNMRVGVHTGMVICGIVGTRRFKFDVWSNDVTLANEMESSGRAGEVHMSECTYEFVKEIYEVTEGESVQDIRKLKVLVEFFDKTEQCYAIKHTQDEAKIKTYFVVRRVDDKPPVTLPRMVPEEDVENHLQATTTDATVAVDHESGVAGGDVAPTVALMTTPAPGGDDAPTAAPTVQDPERRESSDKDLVQGMKDDPATQKVFHSPPLNPFTLDFKDVHMERRYRDLGLRRPKITKLTWATPRVTPLINALANIIYLVLIIVACFIGFSYGEEFGMYNGLPFYVILAFALLIHFLFIVPIVIDIVLWENTPKSFEKLYNALFVWYPRNVLGALILALPSAVVLSNFRPCSFVDTANGYKTMLGILYILMLINYTLFTMYSFWTKSLTATVMVAVSLFFLYGPHLMATVCSKAVFFQQFYYRSADPPLLYINASVEAPPWIHGVRTIDWEMTASLLLTLLFIWFLNREFDISFRVSFNCDRQAIVAKATVSKEQRQANWLLENIIPSYIIDELKSTKKYSQHIEEVGVVFATIANFSEFYDEQFQGGREMLRVLNEIFADFENLLSSPKYKDIEKIKTIGACFMAASGLNLAERRKNRKPDAHLYALMDFCLDLISTLNEFNKQIFNFDFELKIGYNIGDVTAGVIGTTKLLYDIWGDTVNVASRMYSTGHKQKIQVPEVVAKRLGSRYEFKYRGEVFVKGKGDMSTYFLNPGGVEDEVGGGDHGGGGGHH